MSKIRSKDTFPERKVRSFLHRAGFRFRLHVKNLPGRPDIVLPKYRTVIFVHGCYWHRHTECKQGSYFPKDPKQGVEFWKEKLARNVVRDAEKTKLLEDLGWRVEVIWECQTENEECLMKKIVEIFLPFSFRPHFHLRR